MIKNSINLILQGKGGVGKSFIASMLAQYFIKNQAPFFGADTDPVNKSFSGIKGLDVTPVNILENGSISQIKFDALFEAVIENNDTFIIDNGAGTFIPMIKYIKDNTIIDLFDEANKPVFIHSVIFGGQSYYDTLHGLLSTYELIQNSKSVQLVIWLNNFQGSVTLPNEIVTEIQDKTAGIVVIKERQSDAFTTDINKLTTNKLTLNEALQSNEFGMMSKNRLKMVFNEIFEQLDDIYKEVSSEDS